MSNLNSSRCGAPATSLGEPDKPHASPPPQTPLICSVRSLQLLIKAPCPQPISHCGCHLHPECFLGARECAYSRLGDRADGEKRALSQQHREGEQQVSSSLGAKPLVPPPWKPASPKRLGHLRQMDAPGGPSHCDLSAALGAVQKQP